MLRRSWTIVLGAALTLAGTACKDKTALPNPNSAAALCALTPAEFASWQSPGGAGFVAPNSVTFKSTDDCVFYKWSSQMFLWLTSQDATGTLNLFSSTFYTAVESTDTGQFALVRNPGGAVNALKSGRPATISFRARVNKPVVLRTHTPAQLKAARADINNKSNDSTGQAGGGVLVLDGAKVPVDGKPGYATYPVAYYAIQVNDVFAGLQAHQATIPYYKGPGAGAGDFPTTLPQAQQIEAAAKTHYADINQLALEIKSSWVDTAYLTPDQAKGLITIQGEVPAFQEAKNAAGNLVLTWDGTTMAPRTLALVGIHVTGTVAGHPEMVWATFESVFNSPDNTYSYINANFDPKTKACKVGNCLTTVNFSTSNSNPTIFYNGAAGATTPPDPLVTTATSSDFNTGINSTTPGLVATNVVRYNPWGSQQPATPSVTDKVVLNNTLLISLQQTLAPQLVNAGGQGATLANYFQVGAIWGKTVTTPPSGLPQAGPAQFGSLYLANTTMETFQQVSPQNSDPDATATNCFSCHRVGTPGTGVSHVFPNVAASTANRPGPAPSPTASPTVTP